MISCQAVLLLSLAPGVEAQTSPGFVKKFALKKSGLELERRTQAGSFFDVLGRRSAVFGYENRSLEAWVYPLKILDDFNLSFQLQGYPLEIHASRRSIGVADDHHRLVSTEASFDVAGRFDDRMAGLE